MDIHGYAAGFDAGRELYALQQGHTGRINDGKFSRIGEHDIEVSAGIGDSGFGIVDQRDGSEHGRVICGNSDYRLTAVIHDKYTPGRRIVGEIIRGFSRDREGGNLSERGEIEDDQSVVGGGSEAAT